MKVRQFSLHYAKLKNVKIINRAELEATIFQLEKSLENQNLSHQEKDKLTNELNRSKDEFQQINHYRKMNRDYHQKQSKVV